MEGLKKRKHEEGFKKWKGKKKETKMLKRKSSIYVRVCVCVCECMHEVLDEDVVAVWRNGTLG